MKFPVHPNHISGFIAKLRQKAHHQQDASEELALIIEASKATLHEINEQCEDNICRTVADYATDAEKAFSGIMLAINHYPGGIFAEVLTVAYRLQEGYFSEIPRQVDAIDVLAGKIHAAAAALTWNTAVRGQKNKIANQEGGRNSKEVSADDRDERNRLIQAEIDRLCTQRGMGYISACRRVSKTIQKIHPPTPSLSYDRIKKITKNPIK